MGEEEEAALSDDEIEALLDEEEDESADVGGGGGQQAPDAGSMSSDDLLETFQELSESAENVLSTILNREANQSVESLDLLNPNEIINELDDQPESIVMITSELSGAVDGEARYLLDEDDALVLADVMMGQEGENPPDDFDEVYESAIVEMFNQVVNSLANQINDITGESIDLSAPESQVLSREEVQDLIDEESLWIEYAFEVEDLVDSGHFIEIQPRSMGELIWQSQQPDQAESGGGVQQSSESQQPAGGAPTQSSQESSPSGGGDQSEVKSVDFPQFEASDAGDSEGNLNMLMDVPMEVAVELGRTDLQVKEILNLGQGSIIELERLAGEPVDLLVNGRLVARGEVVVIDESFGVRVTSIVSPMDRIK
jgi:flagellar motor switch protein FliN/FliY